MINNYYTIVALVSEIKKEIEFSRIAGCLTRSESVLEIILENSDKMQVDLVVSCLPRMNYVLIDRHPGKKLRGANVLHEAVGSVVESMFVKENDRTIVVSLSDGNSLFMNLFGPHSNVLLEDAEGRLIAQFLKRKKNEPTRGGKQDLASSFPKNVREFAERFIASSGTAQKRLSGIFPTFGRDLVKEALFRLGNGETHLSTSDPSDEQVTRLYEILTGMQNELVSPSARIYYEDGMPFLMSPIELKQLDSREVSVYDSVNSCIVEFVSKAEIHNSHAELKDSLVSRLQKERDELAGTIKKIENDLSVDREEKYRKYGNVLLQHLDEIRKGQSDFELDEERGVLKIPLDEKLSPIQNSQSYFDKSKKARESHKQAIVRREELMKQLGKVERELETVERENDYKILGSLDKKERARTEPQSPFRQFETAGYQIYVGKDAANNDALTFGFAKPNDVFLHARGVSGSHVIIRNKAREYPQKAVIRYAASIAAHYSKARSSKLVPVAYTMKKFVKKAKGKPGAVYLDREEVVFVKPEIPPDSR